MQIDHRGREQPIGKRKPRTAGEHLAVRGDERAAVVDRAAGFVAKEVCVGVADAKRARAFQHEAFANLLFGEGEMAGTGVDQDIGSALREASTGAVGDPGIATDLEADPHAAAIEEQVADWIFVPADFDASHDAGGPAAEPARLVVNAVAGQVLLGDETEQLAVAGESGGVVNPPSKKIGSPKQAMIPRVSGSSRSSTSSAIACTPAEKNMSSQP